MGNKARIYTDSILDLAGGLPGREMRLLLVEQLDIFFKAKCCHSIAGCHQCNIMQFGQCDDIDI